MTDAELIAELARTRDLLKEPVTVLESRMVAVGDRLCEAVRLLGLLTSVFDAVRGTLDRQETGEAIGGLTEATASVAALADRIPGERALLQELAATFEGVTAHMRRMTETMRAIELLAVNARIAAAHTGEYEAELSVFTAEISRLAFRTRGTIGQFADGHRKLVSLLRDANRGQARFASENLDKLRQIAAQLGRSLQAIEERRQRMAATAAEITEHSRQIGQQVGVAVSSLQIGDRTRQRIEHVGEALTFLLDGLATGPDARVDGWQGTFSVDQRRGVIAAACRLQSSQITLAIDEFDRELRQVIGALQRLTGDAGRLVELGLQVYGDGHAESFLAGLGSEIEEAGRLMAVCGAGRAEVVHASTDAGGVLTTLLGEAGAVERIETDVRLAGLNTVLKCGRLGSKGETLRVIAEELNECAGQTVREVQEVMEALRGAEGAAGRLSGGDGVSIDAIGHQASSSIQVLSGVSGGLSDALAALEREGRELTDLLRNTVSGVSVHAELRQSLSGTVRSLDRLAALPHPPEAEVAEASARVLALIRDRYSMAEEREVHDAAMDNRVTTASAPVAEAAASIDDLLF